MSSFFSNFPPVGFRSSSTAAPVFASPINHQVPVHQLNCVTSSFLPRKVSSTSINQNHSGNPNGQSRNNHTIRTASFLDTYDLFCNYPSPSPFSTNTTSTTQFVSTDWPCESSSSLTNESRRKMGNGMDKVLSGLYVGSVRDSKDLDQLRANNITHIISIHDNPKKGLQADVEYLCILALDQPQQNLSQYFAQCNDFIHSARIQGGNVLIHCLAGVSRSITILMAYLMSVTTLNWKEALKCVRVVRTIANPNLGFQRQLQEFEGRRLREERRRMSVKFANRVFLPEDEAEVRRLIVLYQTMQTEQQQVQERRCLSATHVGASTSSHLDISSRGNQDHRRSRQQPNGAPHVHFGPLAPGRSPVMKRRTLPSPVLATNRGAKTV